MSDMLESNVISPSTASCFMDPFTGSTEGENRTEDGPAAALALKSKEGRAEEVRGLVCV